MKTCALFSLFRRLSSRACASAVFEKQPSPLHLSLAICWSWVSCGWRFHFSSFVVNSLTYSVLGVKVSPLLFLHPLFTWFSSSPIFPPRPRPPLTQWSRSHFVSHEMCIVYKLPKPSVKARVKVKWGESFTLNPFMHSVLRSEGEEVNTKVENRRMRACIRPREMWRNVHGWKKCFRILMRFPCF